MARATSILNRAAFIVFAFSLLALGGCGGTKIFEKEPPAVSEQPAVPTDKLAPVKVALLVPLTGKHAQLGNALLNAAQLALFDSGYTNFELLPGDTKGTAEGAGTAAYNAVQGGAQLILGPVFSEEVKAAKMAATFGHINIIAFSTDWEMADENTFIMGFIPFDQINRLTAFAAGHNIKRIGVVAPANEYGKAVLPAYQQAATALGIVTPQAISVQPENPASTGIMRQFALNGTNMMDAVFLPMGGNAAVFTSRALNNDGLLNTTVRRLGTGLFDDPALARARELDGAWFAAPAPAQRADFERRYKQTYNEPAPRIATLTYDATALAATLAQYGLRNGGKPAFDRASITNPNGFSGLDGIFRFNQNGFAERGLAILEFRNGSINVLDPAPTTFQ